MARESNKLFILLLLTDLFFIILYIFHTYPNLLPSHSSWLQKLLSYQSFSLKQDWGYAELFQYIKEFWILIMLLFLAIEKRSFIYLNWSLLFLYLLIDDSCLLHERLGFYMCRHWRFHPGYGLRAQDFGEIAVSCTAGLFFLIIISIPYYFSDIKLKLFSRNLLFMVIGLAFFGVGIDMLHRILNLHGPFWVIVEDGGEMLMLSIIVWFVFSQNVAKEETKL